MIDLETLISELIAGESGMGTILGVFLGEVLPVLVFAVCPIVLWLAFRRFSRRADSHFDSVATGFGIIALSFYAPIVIEMTMVSFAADETLVPEWPFSVASALMVLIGTVAVWRGLKVAAAASRADVGSSRNQS